MIWIILLIALCIVLYFASAYFYGMAIDRNGKSYFSINTEEHSSQEDIREKQLWFNEVFDLNEWVIDSYDDLRLIASNIKQEKDSKGLVLLCHGYLGKGQDMAVFAKLFYDMGYDLLLPDARGHGRSQGDYYGFGWHERKDLLQWLEEVNKEYGDQTPVLLYGISMGAATVMSASGEDLPDNVRLIIEDCGYTSVWDEMTYQMKKLFKLPAFPLAYTTSLYTRFKAGFRFKEASPLKQIKKNDLPILFIHGDADLFVPFEMMERLYKAATTSKEQYIAPGAGHGGAYGVDSKRYIEVIDQFIKKHIQ